MGSGVSKQSKNNSNKVATTTPVEKEEKVVIEKIEKIYPWPDISLGANPIYPDNHVHHLRRTLELNEKTYQSWVNAISDSEQEDKSYKTVTKVKPIKKVKKIKKKIHRTKNFVEPTKNMIEMEKFSNRYNRIFEKTIKPGPFTFSRVSTPPSKFLNSKSYQNL
uniref:Uncharacterized protein n=1 Tax=Strongyloides venezuelensis TaxID=75913 RepID=A0A0K0FGF4_STRVS